MDRSRLLSAGFAATALLVLGFGGWQLVALGAALQAGAPVIEANSALYSLPLFGLALAALGVLLALPDKGQRHPRLVVALAAAFLLLGAGAVAALVFGPALTGRVMIASGYRACATQVGIRTEQVRWVASDHPCP